MLVMGQRRSKVGSLLGLLVVGAVVGAAISSKDIQRYVKIRSM